MWIDRVQRTDTDILFMLNILQFTFAQIQDIMNECEIEKIFIEQMIFADITRNLEKYKSYFLSEKLKTVTDLLWIRELSTVQFTFLSPASPCVIAVHLRSRFTGGLKTGLWRLVSDGEFTETGADTPAAPAASLSA